jgi:hypothetical protein
LSSRKSGVLKSFSSFGWVEFHVAASLSVNRSKVALAATAPAGGSAANDGPAKLAAKIIQGHTLVKFIVDLD